MLPAEYSEMLPAADQWAGSFLSLKTFFIQLFRPAHVIDISLSDCFVRGFVSFCVQHNV